MDPAALGGDPLRAKHWRMHAMQFIRIGLDLAKCIFEVHGVDAQDEVVLRKTLRREGDAPFFAELPPCVVGMGACSGAH